MFGLRAAGGLGNARNHALPRETQRARGLGVKLAKTLPELPVGGMYKGENHRAN